MWPFNRKQKDESDPNNITLTGKGIDFRRSMWGFHCDPFHKLDGEWWEFTGHAPTIPQVGDILLKDKASGKVGKWLVRKVKRVSDPPDMFFLEAGCIGYKE
jgi:hypothetical protein